MKIPQRQFWHRNAGARVYHADSPSWVETGRGLCGANTSRPGYYRSGDPGDWVGYGSEQLAHYPRRHGPTRPCARCLGRLKRAGGPQ